MKKWIFILCILLSGSVFSDNNKDLKVLCLSETGNFPTGMFKPGECELIYRSHAQQVLMQTPRAIENQILNSIKKNHPLVSCNIIEAQIERSRTDSESVLIQMLLAHKYFAKQLSTVDVSILKNLLDLSVFYYYNSENFSRLKQQCSLMSKLFF